MYPTGPAAYDRAITVFSPDGRLFQVEYAREAVKRGTTAVGIVYADGVLLGVDKNVSSKLIVPSSVEKIFKIDDHIAVATSGLVADARKLIDEARVKAQRNRLVYNEPIGATSLTRYVCDIKQAYTMYGGARPFGAALLIAGINEKPHLFETDPSGAFTEYTSTAIGQGKREVEKVFEEKYKETLDRGSAIELAILGLNTVSEGKLSAENLGFTTIEKKQSFKRVGLSEISKHLDKLKDELDSQKPSKKKGKEE
jgi:proteasome alpha subunit